MDHDHDVIGMAVQPSYKTMKIKSSSQVVATVILAATCLTHTITQVNAQEQEPNQTTMMHNNVNNCKKKSPKYNQIPHGQTTYDIDDGGCYFCSKFPGSTFPLSDHGLLSSNCKQMCDSDPLCTAYSIARSPVLHAHEYHWGKAANCCLEREAYPPGVFVDATTATNSNNNNYPNTCQMEIMCWTRYERKNNNEVDDDDCEVVREPTAAATTATTTAIVPTASTESDLCKRVWKAHTHNDEKIKKQIEFIAGGCDYKDDEIFVSMLGEAYTECRAEIDAEEAEASAVGAKKLLQDDKSSRSAWIAHGSIGAISFGLLVPLSVFSAFFRDLIPTCWIYIHVCANIMAFLLTFLTVGIAIATMNSRLGNVGEGHLKEMHHIVGLFLLLLVSLQTANSGSICRPRKRQLMTDDDDDDDEDDDDTSASRSATAAWRSLRYIVTVFSGFIVFCLGTYQVHSGLRLFSMRFGTARWGHVYIWGMAWLILIILGAALWLKRRAKNNNAVATEVQLGSGMVYDPIT